MAYPSVYPTSLDSYATKTDAVDSVMAVDVNELQSAIVAIETKLAITGGDAIIGGAAGRCGIGVASISSVAYGLELVHAGSSGTTYIYHQHSGASSTANKVGFAQSALTSVQKRAIFQILSNFDNVTDASRNSNVVISACAAGTLSTVITIGGTDVTLAGKFGCNGSAAQANYAVGAAATDLATVVTLANNLRTALLNNGIAKVS